ncbi:hypothetical protein A33Q_3622 [Indibacter alkaliphilus LW1]|uniref:Uncharacterized protein n=1 Tax=Indibacter alkaliphilus (strain CCUG 57479 / KCTC 22604 / LW1) TaxID=1189612 RepID=S2DNZ5_INDAL|nr:hypothetical protein A33Q_3622 [Indibacter alkaliphilus LW1]
MVQSLLGRISLKDCANKGQYDRKMKIKKINLFILIGIIDALD